MLHSNISHTKLLFIQCTKWHPILDTHLIAKEAPDALHNTNTASALFWFVLLLCDYSTGLVFEQDRSPDPSQPFLCTAHA